MKTSRYGFTIVELLIVIVVIAILAAISIVAYTGVQQRAQATAISQGLSQTEKALRLWALDEGFQRWPTEETLGGGTSLSTLIEEQAILRQYIQSAPAVSGVHSEDWFYDNDGDRKDNHDSCDATYALDGVNIVIRFVENEKVAQMVDETLDDGNIACGKVKYVNHRIIFTISENQLTDSH